MRDTIGLLGGSFNPIHNGHLRMAQAAWEELSLDRLLIIPDGDPPHKSRELADKRHRLRMAELAAAGRFEVSAMEINRPGKTYTVDTLEALHTLYPDALLYMLIGADTLHEIEGWRNAPRVFELCRFAVFSRGGLPLIDVPGADIVRMHSAIPDISATALRQRVHCGHSLETYTPAAVEDYIGFHRLYNPPVQMPEKAIRKRLKETLPSGRYKHTLGVAKTIQRLASRWRYDELRATLAGLLHDCAKGMTLDEMNAYVDAQGLQAPDSYRKSTALLHAPASAAMARAVYGVTDPEILHAIRYHNTGSVPMSLLDKLLCVADMTEPGRKDFAEEPGIEALRALSMRDLDEAVRQTFQRKLLHIQIRGQQAHPDTAAALAALEKEAMEREGTA